MTRDRALTLAALFLIAYLIAALAGAYRTNEQLDVSTRACRAAAVACPTVEGQRIAAIEIHRTDGSITCEYYRPHGAHITRATVWPRPGEGAAK